MAVMFWVAGAIFTGSYMGRDLKFWEWVCWPETLGKYLRGMRNGG